MPAPSWPGSGPSCGCAAGTAVTASSMAGPPPSSGSPGRSSRSLGSRLRPPAALVSPCDAVGAVPPGSVPVWRAACSCRRTTGRPVLLPYAPPGWPGRTAVSGGVMVPGRLEPARRSGMMPQPAGLAAQNPPGRSRAAVPSRRPAPHHPAGGTGVFPLAYVIIIVVLFYCVVVKIMHNAIIIGKYLTTTHLNLNIVRPREASERRHVYCRAPAFRGRF